MPAPLARLDAWLLGVALERAAGLDAAAVETGDRVRYTKSAAEAIGLVDGRHRRRRCRVPARPDPGRVGRGRRPLRRGDAPEVDLLLPEGPDGPRDQPA